MKPLFVSARGEFKGFRELYTYRWLRDSLHIISAIIKKRPFAVHILASYRGALPREYFATLICNLFNVHIVYDIKAGCFAKEYYSRGRLYRHLARFVIKNSSVILSEGQDIVNFITGEFDREAIYFPNFVPKIEIPEAVPARLTNEAIRVLFAGSCHREKGIIELIEGCAMAAEAGPPIDMALIGEESTEMSNFLDTYPTTSKFKIHRLGKLPHKSVIEAMLSYDVYCYPSMHPGEGHNNSINEALMCGMVVVASNQGFLADILSNCGYILPETTSNAVRNALLDINSDRDAARYISSAGRKKLISQFTSEKANDMLAHAYLSVTHRTIKSAQLTKTRNYY